MKANPSTLAPKFSPEQQKQMAEFKLELQKEMIQLHNQLGEKKAQLKTLQQVEKPNMKSIYSKIDEISDLQNREMKLMADHQNKVRSILTDEQRVKFDMNQGRLCMQHKMQGRPGKEGGMRQMRPGMMHGTQSPKMMMKMNRPDSMKMQKAKN